MRQNRHRRDGHLLGARDFERFPHRAGTGHDENERTCRRSECALKKHSADKRDQRTPVAHNNFGEWFRQSLAKCRLQMLLLGTIQFTENLQLRRASNVLGRIAQAPQAHVPALRFES
jgi:hypothetical protein